MIVWEETNIDPNASLTIADWIAILQKLEKQYGPSHMLWFNAGYNNVSLEVSVNG